MKLLWMFTRTLFSVSGLCTGESFNCSEAILVRKCGFCGSQHSCLNYQLYWGLWTSIVEHFWKQFMFLIPKCLWLFPEQLGSLEMETGMVLCLEFLNRNFKCLQNKLHLSDWGGVGVGAVKRILIPWAWLSQLVTIQQDGILSACVPPAYRELWLLQP